jgi:hypothetical protein
MIRGELQPYIGIGNITLGMSRGALEVLLGVPTAAIDSSDAMPELPSTIRCYFESEGLFAHFQEDRLVGIEFISPARPTWMGVSLLEVSADSVVTLLRKSGPVLVIYGASDGPISFSTGIACYLGGFPETGPQERFESVLLFERGHYDALLANLRNDRL